MGARAQVLIKEEGVYLYTHWGASTIVEDVTRAITSDRGRNRANDPEYLARIIFEEMIGTEHGTETGFGIGTSEHGDIERLVVVENGKITEVQEL